MIIFGAKGFAKEIVDIVHQTNQSRNLVFYDDVSHNLPENIYGFEILKTVSQAENYFKNIDPKYTLGIGNPVLRKKISDKFNKLGGELISTISPEAVIGSFDVVIGTGSNILSGAILSNSVKIGNGCIIYYNSIITHDCTLGDFVEISPAATILGRCTIGSFTQIGAKATILPDIKIGDNVIIGAGSVVTKDVPSNSMVYGVPAKIIKSLPELKW